MQAGRRLSGRGLPATWGLPAPLLAAQLLTTRAFSPPRYYALFMQAGRRLSGWGLPATWGLPVALDILRLGCVDWHNPSDDGRVGCKGGCAVRPRGGTRGGEEGRRGTGRDSTGLIFSATRLHATQGEREGDLRFYALQLCTNLLSELHTLCVCTDCAGRFSDNPFVAGDHGWLRFYAGSPILSSDGHHLGTLCCMDR